MLEVANVTKQYPTPKGPLTVVSDATFTLAPGEAAAITGPSGSGKSSLLYMLGALEPPTRGSVRLEGQDPFALAPSALAEFRNARIGFVFQDHCLLPQCSVLENVLVPTLVAPKGRGPCRTGRRHGPCHTLAAGRRAVRSPGPSAGRAVGRRAPARGRGPGARPPAAAGAVRRTHRQPGPGVGRRRGRAARGSAPVVAQHPGGRDAQRAVWPRCFQRGSRSRTAASSGSAKSEAAPRSAVSVGPASRG